MNGACAIKLDFICLPRRISDKRDNCNKWPEVSVVKQKIVKTNNKQFDDSKTPKWLEKLINSYRQKRFTGKTGKLKDTKKIPF